MRRIALPIALALAVCGIATTSAFAPTSPPRPQALQQSMDEHEMQLLAAVTAPPSVPAGSAIDQMITVSAVEPAATTAKLTAWTRDGDVWRKDIGPITAFVGSDGIGEAREGIARTPAGVFKLTEAFGIAENNGTKLPYFKVDDSDWWVSDVNSPEYNKHFRCAPGKCPFNERAGERLITAGAVYRHAVVIDYNRNPVKRGAGSAFFLHVSENKPTAGCVAVGPAELDEIMRWLDPAKNPAINIG